MIERLANPSHPEPSNARLRFELIFASVWLAVGLFLVPALIFWVGIVMLGPYGESTGGGLGDFYADFFGDLASGVGRTWLLALGPLILVTLVRLVFIGVGPKAEPTGDEPPPAVRTAPVPSDHRRLEPKIGE